MEKALFFIVGLLLLGLTDGYSKEIKDTIWTAEKDRLIITYDVKYTNDQITIQIGNIQKKLGRINSKRYKKLDEVVALFFDRTGNYREVSFSNMVPEAFMVPDALRYDKSDNGYYFIQDNPGLIFNVGEKKDAILSIPVYLAHYEGKHRYKLFTVAPKLNIRIAKSHVAGRNSNEEPVKQTILSSIETEDISEEVTEALTCINTINMLLDTQGKLPFSDGLQYEITRLRLMQDKVSDKEVSAKIHETLAKCDMKKEELKEAESDAARRVREEAEHQAKIAEEKARAQQDSIQVAAQQREKEEKERNLWFMVAGITFGILCFVGNQVFQHFRNMKNQKNMMEMQQTIAKQAENDAKRRTKSYIRSQTNKAVNDTVNKGRRAVRPKNNGAGGNKNKGNFSI